MKYYVYLIGFIISVILAVVGGVAYRYLEYENEQQTAVVAYSSIQQFLASKPCLSVASLARLSKIITEAMNGGVRISRNPTQEPFIENITNWDIQSAFFLSLQVIGSVGFGNAPPVTAGGRGFCIGFGVLGIPLFIVAVYAVGHQIRSALERLRTRLYNNVFKTKAPPSDSAKGYIVTFTLFIVIGLSVFIFTAAGVFMTLESWTYAEALYFCFVTVLTIGFADYLPAETSPAYIRTWYRLGVGLWILVTLLWFGSIFTTLRLVLKYDEIHEPFRVGDDDDDSQYQRKIKVSRHWKKKFDRQWAKLSRQKRQQHHQVYQRAPKPSQESLDSAYRVAKLDALPVFAAPLKTAVAPLYDATGNHVTLASQASAIGGCGNSSISQVNVGKR